MKKNLIEEGCGLSNNSETRIYRYGETINYKNEDYCVIDYSNANKDYVTLIKQDPLTYDELIAYNSGYEIGRDSLDNNIGTLSYYKSSTCYYNSDNDNNTTGCNIDYNNSYIKNVVDNWSNSILSDLKEVDGYKVRLITYEELKILGHEFYDYTGHHKSQKSDYDCLYSDADYWTSSNGIEDIDYKKEIVSKNSNSNGLKYMDKLYAIRPVINLKKCALNGTC